jgi:hypothetical protein
LAPSNGYCDGSPITGFASEASKHRPIPWHRCEHRQSSETQNVHDSVSFLTRTVRRPMQGVTSRLKPFGVECPLHPLRGELREQETTVRSPPFASTKCTTQPAPKCPPTRTTTPPSGVSVCTESRRTRCNCGAIRFRQHAESASLFESVSIWMKGGWKETQGVQRPISAKKPVSESRMAWLNTFETKRKKAPHWTSSRVCDVQVAEGVGLAANPLYPLSHCNH